MMKVLVGYPSVTEEFVVVERALTPPAAIQRIIEPETLVGLQQAADQVYVDPSLIEFAVQLAHASREPARVGLGDLARYVTFGASPRSSISLVLAACALAYLRGREYVVPEDLSDLALDVLRHRLVLSYEALSDEVTPDLILAKILANLPVPEPAGRGR
jgi:MoxR-like ATPase